MEKYYSFMNYADTIPFVEIAFAIAVAIIVITGSINLIRWWKERENRLNEESLREDKRKREYLKD